MADLARVAERVWFGDDALSRSARAALRPASALYGGVARARGALFDRGTLRVHALALPALSVGNVTVGGTGKTPVASWLAGRLADAGASPAIVLRGYGDDEPLVHARLRSDVRVVVDADRVRGARTAKANGADVVVLDDAFQHRRARRMFDLVLVAAEHGDVPARVLPAGPYREPIDALRRASAIVVTRKSADDALTERTLATIAKVAPDVPRVVAALKLDVLHRWDGGEAPLVTLSGERVVAVAAVGNPRAFFTQLDRTGATVLPLAYADHHAFSAADVESIVRRADGAARVVCTLKDAVKLGPVWPRLAPPLWYVSQRVALEQGGDVIDRMLARVLAARHHPSDNTGSGRPS